MSRQIHILIVEDEGAIRSGLSDVLVFHGYGVDAAATGPEGLRKALTGQFDLILLDIMLPGMDGYEICDRIRAQDAEQPIIMLTAKTSDEEIIQGLKLGADDYVNKPFSIQQLLVADRSGFAAAHTPESRWPRTIRLRNVTIDTENLSGKSGAKSFTFTPARDRGFELPGAEPGPAGIEGRVY